jgi:hypothetical protein
MDPRTEQERIDSFKRILGINTRPEMPDPLRTKPFVLGDLGEDLKFVLCKTVYEPSDFGPKLATAILLENEIRGMPGQYEQYAVLSVNLPESQKLEEGEFYLKDQGNQRIICGLLRRAGFLQAVVGQAGLDKYPPVKLGHYYEHSRVYRLSEAVGKLLTETEK